MVSTSRRFVFRSIGALALCLTAGCSGNAAPQAALAGGGNGVGGLGGAPSPGGGASGLSTAGQTAQGGAPNGSVGGAESGGGESANAGTSGSLAFAGNGGTAGTPPTAACGMTGTQSEPGTAGDGKVQLSAPYSPAPESKAHLNGAAAGKVNGVDVGSTKLTPLLYSGKAPYPVLNKLLKYEYWIYVPAQYKPGCPAALMVFQDGLHFVGIDDAQINAPTVMDNLIASGDMPVTIGLFINPGEPDGHYDGHEYGNRSAQYDTNSPAYAAFLIDEFLPATVLKDYAVVSDPDGWGTSGHSSGGIAAFMTGWYRPEKFHKLLTLDASFPNTRDYMGSSLIAAIGSSAAKPLRVYLMSGPNDLGGWYSANTAAANALAAKSYHYQYRTEDSMHYPPLAAQQDFAAALRWMWRSYKL